MYNKFVVIKTEDLTGVEKDIIAGITARIGKYNKYYVVNQDEPYACIIRCFIETQIKMKTKGE